MSTPSWLPIPKDSDFSIDNLPYGIFSTPDNPKPRMGVAIREYILDIIALADHGLFKDLNFSTNTLRESTLNSFASLGPEVHSGFRARLQDILKKDGPYAEEVQNRLERRREVLVDLATATMHMPMRLHGYTDVLAGYHHTVNCAQMVHPGMKAEEFAPRFYDTPVSLNVRNSAFVVSETSFARPRGPILVDGKLECRPSQDMDFEVEFAVLVGKPSKRDHPINVDKAGEHIFGYVLMNDWSARDVQMTETRPLGPFNGKQSCTTISPWVVTPDALAPFLTTLKQEVMTVSVDMFDTVLTYHKRPLMPYLTHSSTPKVYDFPIKATLELPSGSRYHIASCNTKNVIWTFEQMLAHHTISGCPLETGDVIATGTLSGPSKAEIGCWYELTEGGKKSSVFESEAGETGAKRIYLEDGDTVEFSASQPAVEGRGRVGFGLCRGTLLPVIDS